MYLQNVQLQYLCGLLAAQQAAQIGHCPGLIAMHKFLDVCARLLIHLICLRLQELHVSTESLKGNSTHSDHELPCLVDIMRTCMRRGCYLCPQMQEQSVGVFCIPLCSHLMYCLFPHLQAHMHLHPHVSRKHEPIIEGIMQRRLKMVKLG